MRLFAYFIKLLLIVSSIVLIQSCYAEELSSNNKTGKSEASALKSLSTSDLISVLTEEFEGSSPCEKKSQKNDGLDEDECFKSVESELIQRAPVKELLSEMEHGWLPRVGEAAYIVEKIGGTEAEAGLKRIAEQYTDERAYFALMHFAVNCQEWALSRLNTNESSVPSYIWADALSRFGDCGYKPATERLVNSLNAASLNVVDAACESLKELYPNGPGCTLGPPDDQESWLKWLNQHGDKSKSE